MEQWWKLKDVPNGKILMSLSWLETSKDISVLESKSSLYFMSFRVSKQIDRRKRPIRTNYTRRNFSVQVEFVISKFVLVEFSLCTTQLVQISHSTVFF